MDNKDSMIRMFNVSKRYGKKYAVKGISLEITAGEFVFLTGPSGAGKSTIMKMIYLAERASDGQIIVDGMNLDRISHARAPLLRRRIGVIFQDFKLIPNRTVFANVALVLEAAGERPGVIKPRVMEVLKTMGIDGKANALPPSLSGGEQQRAAVARAVVGNPGIILADEPTASLDNRSAQAVLDSLVQFHAMGTTILIASHNIQMVSSLSRARSIFLVDGSLG